jgi:hypothetical protein
MNKQSIIAICMMLGLSLYGYAAFAQSPVPTLYGNEMPSSTGTDAVNGTTAGPGAYVAPAVPVANDSGDYELGKDKAPTAEGVLGNVLPPVISMYDLRIWVIVSGILSLIAIVMSVIALSEVKRRI